MLSPSTVHGWANIKIMEEEKVMARRFLSAEHTKSTIDYAQDEIETMIRQLRIERADLAVVIVELRRLADFVSAQADNLSTTWPDLLDGTAAESLED